MYVEWKQLSVKPVYYSGFVFFLFSAAKKCAQHCGGCLVSSCLVSSHLRRRGSHKCLSQFVSVLEGTLTCVDSFWRRANCSWLQSVTSEPDELFMACVEEVMVTCRVYVCVSVVLLIWTPVCMCVSVVLLVWTPVCMWVCVRVNCPTLYLIPE